MESDSSLILNQFRAAPHVYEMLREQYAANPRALSLAAAWFERMSEESLGRALCLPVAACTAVNWLRQERIIGDDAGAVRVGDFFKVMLPYHGIEAGAMAPPYDQGWRVIDPNGNVYHHAVAAFVRRFGVRAYPINRFSSVAWPFQHFPGVPLVFAVSLNNSFLSLGFPSRAFEPKGRHVVDVMGVTGNRAHIADSYQELDAGTHPRFQEIETNTVDGYLRYEDDRAPQGIVFSLTELSIPPEHRGMLHIPEAVLAALAPLT